MYKILSRFNECNLKIHLVGADDTMTVEDWYKGDKYQIEQFLIDDGSVLLNTQVDQLVSAMAAFIPPTSGDFIPPQELRDELQTTITAAWS